jgi:hypothetical protein
MTSSFGVEYGGTPAYRREVNLEKIKKPSSP